MSESTDNDDKEGKRMKDSDVQQEQVSKEGNVDLPFHKLTISPLKSGGCSSSSERSNEELQSKDGQFHKEDFVFELQLTQDDIEYTLYIPEQTAAEHFPPVPIYEDWHKGQIEISDTQNQNWNMKIVYIRLSAGFFIETRWDEFVARHNLEAMDVIRFYRPPSPLHKFHFLIRHVRRRDNPPEFKPENFLFRQQMTSTFKYILDLPKEQVRKYFPGIEFSGVRRLHFTDVENTDWPMTISLARNNKAYMLLNGWYLFVNKHRLEAGDEVRFYKPVRPLDKGHFLIEYVKREEAGGGTSSSSQNDQLGGGKKDGNKGDRENRGGRNHGGGGYSSSPDKGKTICCWTWKSLSGWRPWRCLCE
ncbi:hypothetical protein TEA_017525 [Camellia sinensis var. sinensis]|uniref:TF-B3 domain-containing protein n=1 Tax=Camellia sinensis var. sinensis TaxID=542762 RepID=A0A4S4DBP3_CAMSN|nr:hypothetical protein TEA_017525 [Camellia sinensis var. sinensis]